MVKEEISPKGYRNGLTEILTDVNEDVENLLNKLNRLLGEKQITFEEYKKRLRME